MISKKKFLLSGILEEFHDLSLKDFKGDKKVMEEVKGYIENIDNAYKNGIGIFLHGKVGTGKTLLSICILKSALEEGYSAQFTSLGAIIEILTQGWYDNEKRKLFVDRIKNVDFLVVDDLGREFKGKSGLTETVFDNVMRYRTMRKKVTIVTTNLEKDEMEDIFGAGVKSLMRSSVLFLEVKDEKDYRWILAKGLRKKLYGGK